MDVEKADLRGILCRNIGVLVVSKHFQQRNCFSNEALLKIQLGGGILRQFKSLLFGGEILLPIETYGVQVENLTTCGLREKSPVTFHSNGDTFGSEITTPGPQIAIRWACPRQARVVLLY